ncbi:MAG: hypothetical protein Q4D10_00045 [Bacteroidales bacterium]|nr:hypothetical protein [Bacteroidales bacterium]
MKIFGILLLSLLTLSAAAQQQGQSEQDKIKEEKQLREYIDKNVEQTGINLGLEDWQLFYVDSILTHDVTAMTAEIKQLQSSKVSNSAVYEQVQDKWLEAIYQAMGKVLNEDQWNKYLKQGAAREKKARDKRKAKLEAKGEK